MSAGSGTETVPFAGRTSRRSFLGRAAITAGGATVLATVGSKAVADAAVVSSQPGLLQIQSFTGTTDDDKLTAALSYAAAQTYTPALQFKTGVTTLSQSGRAPFSGMKLVGPYGPGPKNLELSAGKYTAGHVQLNVGNGTASWFNGSGSLYDIFIGDCAFQYGAGGQFWHQPTGTLYACEFRSLTHYGSQHVFGTPTAKALMTQVVFTGHWTVLGSTDVSFTMGGSDNDLWVSGYLNIEPAGSTAGAGRYQLVFDSMEKTNVGSVYVTCENDWRGLWVRDGSYGLNINGGRFEGGSASTPCNGSVIKVDAGIVGFRDCWFAYAMNAPISGENGAIQVNGGNVLVDRATYSRGNSAATVPLICASGGKTEVRSAGGVSGIPVLMRGGGSYVADASVTLA